MNIEHLYQILNSTTAQFRKGETIVRREAPSGVQTREVFAMPHESSATDLVCVDLHFVTIGVDSAKAEAARADLIKILAEWPDPSELANGPSYITAGATIGDQGAAFQLFELGKVLGLWDVITPAMYGMTGEEADSAAGPAVSSGPSGTEEQSAS